MHVLHEAIELRQQVNCASRYCLYIELRQQVRPAPAGEETITWLSGIDAFW